MMWSGDLLSQQLVIVNADQINSPWWRPDFLAVESDQRIRFARLKCSVLIYVLYGLFTDKVLLLIWSLIM